jgi:hypothetical protein
MVKFQGFFAVFAIALTLFAFVDCAMRDETQIKKLPKWGWLLIIVLLNWSDRLPRYWPYWKVAEPPQKGQATHYSAR